MDQTGVRINVPPPSVMKNEIVVSGEKDGVQQAVTSIMKIYDEKVKLISRPVYAKFYGCYSKSTVRSLMEPSSG